MQAYAARGRAAAARDRPGAGALPHAVGALGRRRDPGARRPGPAARGVPASTRSSAASTTSPTWIPDPPEGLLPLGRRRAPGPANASGTRASTPAGPPPRSRGTPSDPLPTDPDWAGGSLYDDGRQREVASSPAALWSVIEGIGGENGWYSFPLAWEVRGLLDRVVGGVGLRRGRRDPEHLYVGDALDFWRVEERRPEELLRLRAEMRLPGLAWLDLRVDRGRRAGPRSTTSARSSIPAGSPGTSTGGRWRPSTASCSARWCATSPGRPSSAGRAGAVGHRAGAHAFGFMRSRVPLGSPGKIDPRSPEDTRQRLDRISLSTMR